MALKVGDRVKVIAHKYGEEQQFGLIGIIYSIRIPTAFGLDIQVEFSKQPGDTNSYNEDDLELLTPQLFLEAEFSLDEISQGQEIIAQMG